MVTCDDCGVRVSSTGYLGGGIVCFDCARISRRKQERGEEGDDLADEARELADVDRRLGGED